LNRRDAEGAEKREGEIEITVEEACVGCGEERTASLPPLANRIALVPKLRFGTSSPEAPLPKAGRGRRVSA
jgi:hypothetical protein